MHKTIEDTISAMFQSVLDQTDGVFLIESKTDDKTKTTTFTIDGDSPVNLRTITQLTRTLSKQIDEVMAEDETPFRFEISTPGADKPLKFLRQFPKHIGRNFLIKTTEFQLEGILKALTDNTITIEPKPNKKEPLAGAKIINFEDIVAATIVLSFK